MSFQRHKMLIALSATLMGASVGQASLIVGSLPLNGGTGAQNGANLSVSTMITAVMTLNLSLGSGDYAFIPVGTNFGSTTLNYTSHATPGAFSCSNAVFGSCAATNDPSNQIITKTANFLDVFIVGIFTPGTSAG